MNASRPPIEVLNRDEVKASVSDGSICLIDVREPHEFAAGHIPGAVSMPLSSLDPAALPLDRRVVFSCNSGRRTLQALELAHRAGRHDVRAHYAGSFNDWRAAGEPIEQG